MILNPVHGNIQNPPLFIMSSLMLYMCHHVSSPSFHIMSVGSPVKLFWFKTMSSVVIVCPCLFEKFHFRSSFQQKENVQIDIDSWGSRSCNELSSIASAVDLRLEGNTSSSGLRDGPGYDVERPLAHGHCQEESRKREFGWHRNCIFTRHRCYSYEAVRKLEIRRSVTWGKLLQKSVYEGADCQQG